MSESIIKIETESNPKMDESESANLPLLEYGDRSSSSREASPSPPAIDVESPLAILLAKQCEGKNRAQKVKILEKAVEHGNLFLDNISQILAQPQFASDFPACKTRNDEIAIIRAKPNGTQIRVGFIGQTGAGKTTIMNSLLLENILPRSEEGSCTAVVVEVSWNDYDDPNLRYRAEISGISSEEFREELLRLYQDKKAWDSPPDGEDNDPDLELKQRMDYTLSKISCLFPEINNLKDLEKFSVDSLLNRDCCRRLLGKTILRSCGTQDEFYGCIRPFIDTSKSKNGAGVEASLWPLVKVVKLRIKSEILRNGLILVDLPGSGDTSAARCKVAENYRKNLTVACVVAPAQRAASDKNAHDLLSSLARTNMQLDGIFNSDSLFFVVSQIDRLEEVPEYIRDHPNLAESLSDDFSRATDKAKQIEKLDMDLKQTLRDLEINEKQMQRLEAKNREIERRIEKLSNSTHTGRKRKHDESHGGEDLSSHAAALQHGQKLLIDVQERVQEFIKELGSTERKKKTLVDDLKNTNYRLKKACIENRNQIHIEAAHKEYENGLQQMGETVTSGFLNVFCVSARVFNLLQRGNEGKALERGFKSKGETGIPSLRDAIIASTWGLRERNARAFTADVESAFDRLKLWSSDISSDYLMVADERAKLESLFEAHFIALAKKFYQLHNQTTDSIERLMKKKIYTRMPKLARQAAEAAKNVVRAWSQLPMLWNTHRAINKNGGIWKSSKGINYNWNEELIENYKGIIIKDWYRTFFKQLGEEQKSYETEVEVLITEFSKIFVASADEISKAMAEAVVLLRGNVLRMQTHLRHRASTIFEEIQNKSKESHRLIDIGVADAWADVFEECGAETGKGLYKRNQETHRLHVNGAGGFAMYRGACADIETALRETSDGLHNKFTTIYNEEVERIKDDVKILLDRHSAAGSRHSSRRATSITKKNLRNALLPYFEALEKAWGIEPVIEEEFEDQDDQPAEQEVAEPVLPAFTNDIEAFLSQAIIDLEDDA